jgi:hypothetical protein
MEKALHVINTSAIGKRYLTRVGNDSESPGLIDPIHHVVHLVYG